MIIEKNLPFLPLWLRADTFRPVRGWLAGTDAYLLYSLARRGPSTGCIVEIGSAWGRSTVFLAAGSKVAGREVVFAIDPHTGDQWFLEGVAPPRGGSPNGPKSELDSQFTSLTEFMRNIRRFRLADWVKPVVSTASMAAETLETGPIRLLYIDGLHTYEGVKEDIRNWVPRLAPGGAVVFDDYFNSRPDVGVSRAVDELLLSGLVRSKLQRARNLAWTIRE